MYCVAYSYMPSNFISNPPYTSVWMFPQHLSAHSQFPSCIRHILSSSESSDSNFLQNKYFLPPSHPSSSLLWYLWILAVTYPCVFMQVWRWLRLLHLLPVFLKEKLLPLLTVLPPAAQGEFNSPTSTLSLLRSPRSRFYPAYWIELMSLDLPPFLSGNP